jgi:hypothetical protein
MLNLLPNIGILKTQLNKNITEDRILASHYSLELLPYSLHATYQAFFDFVQAERDLVNTTFSQNSDKEGTYLIGPAGRDKLAFKVDSFFEVARRTQNAVIPYISRALSTSLPQSLNELVKRIESGKLVLPEKIASDLIGYWQHHGIKVKAYRDFSQHYGLVISDVRIFCSCEGLPAIFLELPNNPEERNPSKHIFGEPAIQALSYMQQELCWLIRFCNEVTCALIKPIGEKKSVSAGIALRPPLLIGANIEISGHHLSSDESLQLPIKNLISQYTKL